MERARDVVESYQKERKGKTHVLGALQGATGQIISSVQELKFNRDNFEMMKELKGKREMLEVIIKILNYPQEISENFTLDPHGSLDLAMELLMMADAHNDSWFGKLIRTKLRTTFQDIEPLATGNTKMYIGIYRQICYSEGRSCTECIQARLEEMLARILAKEPFTLVQLIQIPTTLSNWEDKVSGFFEKYKLTGIDPYKSLDVTMGLSNGIRWLKESLYEAIKPSFSSESLNDSFIQELANGIESVSLLFTWLGNEQANTDLFTAVMHRWLAIYSDALTGKNDRTGNAVKDAFNQTITIARADVMYDITKRFFPVVVTQFLERFIDPRVFMSRIDPLLMYQLIEVCEITNIRLFEEGNQVATRRVLLRFMSVIENTIRMNEYEAETIIKNITARITSEPVTKDEKHYLRQSWNNIVANVSEP